jgi:hypothetical protein
MEERKLTDNKTEFLTDVITLDLESLEGFLKTMEILNDDPLVENQIDTAKLIIKGLHKKLKLIHEKYKFRVDGSLCRPVNALQWDLRLSEIQEQLQEGH